jgi:hypothetical protein
MAANYLGVKCWARLRCFLRDFTSSQSGYFARFTRVGDDDAAGLESVFQRKTRISATQFAAEQVRFEARRGHNQISPIALKRPRSKGEICRRPGRKLKNPGGLGGSPPKGLRWMSIICSRCEAFQRFSLGILGGIPPNPPNSFFLPIFENGKPPR